MKNLIMLLGSLTMVGGTTLSLANITETKQNNVLTVTSKEFDKNQGGYGFEAITKYNNKWYGVVIQKTQINFYRVNNQSNSSFNLINSLPTNNTVTY
ncbi:MAG: hypothetical protein LBS95_02815 [Mycoplasmataceae bacterium]|nr:hypothetical protein [Mycoplasmataceae bacterium]